MMPVQHVPSFPSRDDANALIDQIVHDLRKSNNNNNHCHPPSVVSSVVNSTSTVTVKIKEEKLLLQLKTIHRQLFEAIQKAEYAYATTLASQQKQLRRADALTYEQSQLELRIQILQSDVSATTPHLLQLAAEELGVLEKIGEEVETETTDTAGTAAAAETNTDTTTGSTSTTTPPATTTLTPNHAKDILKQYFHGLDIANPNDREPILAQLHDAITARGQLEGSLKTKKEHLGRVLKELKSVTHTLTSLPAQLSILDRASLPLQKLFSSILSPGGGGGGGGGGEGIANSSSFSSSSSSERKHRIELAQSLPPPLYVLYEHIQHYIDFDWMKTQPAFQLSQSQLQQQIWTLTTSSTLASSAENKNLVLLQLPIPDISSSSSSKNNPNNHKTKNNVVTIQFAFDETYHVVTTAITTTTPTTTESSSSSSNHLHHVLLQEVVLQELFPGDISGVNRIPSSLSLSSRRTGHHYPYRWCNVLAGLYFPPLSSSQQQQQQQKQQQQTTTTTNTTTIRPAQSPAPLLFPTSRMICAALSRRVRSNAVLTYLLQSLQRGQMPALPPSTLSLSCSTAGSSSSTTTTATTTTLGWKVANFAACDDEKADSAVYAESIKDDDDDLRRLYPTTPLTRTYTLSIIPNDNNGNNNNKDRHNHPVQEEEEGVVVVRATVRIHLARYPDIPPVWSLQEEELEQRLNETLIDRLARTRASTTVGRRVHGSSSSSNNNNKNDINMDIDNDDNNDDDDTSLLDWILAIQLHELMASIDGRSNNRKRKFAQ